MKRNAICGDVGQNYTVQAKLSHFAICLVRYIYQLFLFGADTIRDAKATCPPNAKDPLWYKDAVVYCLYVDLFAETFGGLVKRLDYLQDLGVTCLWLLPILSSPMNDAGFDIDDYYRVRDELLDGAGNAEDRQRSFDEFMQQAHNRGIKVIFDIAMNHVSVEHAWFQQARQNVSSPYRDYFIWSNTRDKYSAARVIFKGIEHSKWAPMGDAFYMHRFFAHQPDLNYRNPAVLTAITEVLLYWLRRGVDGFRADAVPFMWKEENTNCEGLENVHILLQFMRAALDYVQPSTMLLAEACQPPHDVCSHTKALYTSLLMIRRLYHISVMITNAMLRTISRSCLESFVL